MPGGDPSEAASCEIRPRMSSRAVRNRVRNCSGVKAGSSEAGSGIGQCSLCSRPGKTAHTSSAQSGITGSADPASTSSTDSEIRSDGCQYRRPISTIASMAYGLAWEGLDPALKTSASLPNAGVPTPPPFGYELSWRHTKIGLFPSRTLPSL